jgi:imidazolonepropionase-like amidohydrolase
MQGSLDRKMPAGLGANLKLAHALAAVAALRRAGVEVLAGTDAPSPGVAHGLSLHRELELLVLAGLTPSEALAAATSAPARAYGLHDRGRIAPGRHADLVLVNGDPTADVRATRDIAGVWKRGVRCPRPAAP